MRRSGTGSGGGYGSTQHRDSRAPKTEPVAHRVREGGAGQIGQSQGSHTTEGKETSYRGEKLYGGRGYEPPKMITDPVKAVGVGGGRTIYSCGTQGTQGATNPGSPRPNSQREALEGE